jgi:enterochelin esterase-like enzyme
MLSPTTVSVLLLAAASLAAQNPNGGRPRRDQPAPAVELKNFTHQEKSFASAAVAADMPYGIYLPTGYDDAANKDTRWPLVIWLHGMFEDHKRFHGRGGAPVLDKAVTDGLLPPCVFVLANGGRTSMYINAGEKKNFQDLVQKDLLEHVTATYRVATERGQRALMGISLGGMASLRIGFTHPDLFGTIAVHSSAVFPTDPKQLSPRVLQNASRFGLDEVFGNPIDEKLWKATNPLGLAETLDPKSLDGLRLYFDAGTDDGYGFGPPNKLLHEALEKQKVPHTWDYVKGGGHAWGSGFKDESLLASLKFVGDGFRAAAAGSAGSKDAAKGSDAAKGAPAKKDDGGGH